MSSLFLRQDGAVTLLGGDAVHDANDTSVYDAWTKKVLGFQPQYMAVWVTPDAVQPLNRRVHKTAEQAAASMERSAARAPKGARTDVAALCFGVMSTQRLNRLLCMAVTVATARPGAPLHVVQQFLHDLHQQGCLLPKPHPHRRYAGRHLMTSSEATAGVEYAAVRAAQAWATIIQEQEDRGDPWHRRLEKEAWRDILAACQACGFIQDFSTSAITTRQRGIPLFDESPSDTDARLTQPA